ncbi:MAG: hypothetical protein HY655_09545 [Acidobacteria bacterium]|nr:hypothetical protein [Acidobacteriota bacterium]
MTAVIVGLASIVSLVAQKDDKKPTAAQAREIQIAVKTVDNTAAGQPGPDDLRLAWVREDYLKAQGRKQYVPFTVSIDPSRVRGGQVALYWRVVSKTPASDATATPPAKPNTADKKRVDYAYEDVATVPVTASQAPMRISRSFTVPSGSYDVFVLAKEPTSTEKIAPIPKVSVLTHEVTVPDFWNGDLSTSSVIIAERIEPLPAPLTPQQQADRPYALGTMEIIPAPDTNFTKKSELSTFLLIYNPKIDADNKPDVQVEYNFYAKPAGAAEEKFFNKTQPQNLNGQTLPPQFDLAAGHQLQTGQAVPLAGFPEGDYRLEIKVTDKIANKSLTREINFSVGPS